MLGFGSLSELPLSSVPQEAITHATSGALTGQGSAVAGSSTRFRAHATDGALTGAPSVIVGSADRQSSSVAHTAIGSLVGQGATVVGTAFLSHLHATSGALAGQGAVIVGSAELTPYAPTVHVTDGILIGPGSIIVGQAALVTQVIGGGGPGNAVTQPKKKGWANERAQFEESQIERIAQTLTESEQPQVKKIARKLVDYTGEIKQIASLQRELEKLESAKVSRILDQERNQDIKVALAELNEILQDDEDAAEALMMLHEMETRQVLGILGILR